MAYDRRYFLKLFGMHLINWKTVTMGKHFGARALVYKVLYQGYFWSTLKREIYLLDVEQAKLLLPRARSPMVFLQLVTPTLRLLVSTFFAKKMCGQK